MKEKNDIFTVPVCFLGRIRSSYEEGPFLLSEVRVVGLEVETARKSNCSTDKVEGVRKKGWEKRGKDGIAQQEEPEAKRESKLNFGQKRKRGDLENFFFLICNFNESIANSFFNFLKITKF